MAMKPRVRAVKRLEQIADAVVLQPPERMVADINGVVVTHAKSTTWTPKQQSTLEIATQMLIGLCYPGVKINSEVK